MAPGTDNDFHGIPRARTIQVQPARSATLVAGAKWHFGHDPEGIAGVMPIGPRGRLTRLVGSNPA